MTKLCARGYNCSRFLFGFDMVQIKELTEREMQIAKECCKGKSSRAIAIELGVSKRTIDSHKSNIYHKLGINNNTALILKLLNVK